MESNRILMLAVLISVQACTAQSVTPNPLEIQLLTKELTYPDSSKSELLRLSNDVSFYIKNKSDKSYFVVLDTSGIKLEKEGTVLKDPHPYTAFRPMLIVKDNLNNILTTEMGYFRPDLDDSTVIEEFNQRFKRLEEFQEKALSNYGHLNTHNLDLRYLYGQYADDYGITLMPKDSVKISIEIGLPSNDDGLGTFLEFVDIEAPNEYKAHIEIHSSKKLIQSMLDDKQLIELKKEGILIWNGKIASKTIPLHCDK